MTSKSIAITLTTAILCFACITQKQEKVSSHISQLTEDNFKCTFDKTHSEAIKAKIATMPDFLRGWDANKSQEIYDALAEIPDPYLQYLYERYKSGFYIGPQGAGMGGVTQISGDGNTEWPDHIFLSTTINVEFGLPHEVGHAVEPFIIAQAAEKAKMSWSDYREVYNQDLAKARAEAVSNPKVRSYASNEGEFFPEIFANWYCSTEAKKFIADLGSNQIAYSFMSKYVLPPLYESGSAQTITPPLAIYLLKDSGNSAVSGYMAVLAADIDADQVYVCRGDAKACTQNPKSVAAFNKIKATANRQFFASTQTFSLNDAEKTAWTLVATKADKSLLSAVAIQFSK